MLCYPVLERRLVMLWRDCSAAWGGRERGIGRHLSALAVKAAVVLDTLFWTLF